MTAFLAWTIRLRTQLQRKVYGSSSSQKGGGKSTTTTTQKGGGRGKGGENEAFELALNAWAKSIAGR